MPSRSRPQPSGQQPRDHLGDTAVRRCPVVHRRPPPSCWATTQAGRTRAITALSSSGSVILTTSASSATPCAGAPAYRSTAVTLDAEALEMTVSIRAQAHRSPAASPAWSTRIGCARPRAGLLIREQASARAADPASLPHDGRLAVGFRQTDGVHVTVKSVCAAQVGHQRRGVRHHYQLGRLRGPEDQACKRGQQIRAGWTPAR